MDDEFLDCAFRCTRCTWTGARDELMYSRLLGAICPMCRANVEALTDFVYVQAVKLYPGGRKSLRLTRAANLVDVDTAIASLGQGSAVYISEESLPELKRRWKP
jgi:hypothetical protein